MEFLRVTVQYRQLKFAVPGGLALQNLEGN